MSIAESLMRESAWLAEVAVRVRALEAENTTLRVALADAHAGQAELVRRTYRRGYVTGRSSVRRGQPASTAPERQARGETRTLLTEQRGR